MDRNSYTAQRLHCSTPQHLHLTARRTFIGPVPKGWTENPRKRDSYGDVITKHYQTRVQSFSAQTTHPTLSRRSSEAPAPAKTTLPSTITKPSLSVPPDAAANNPSFSPRESVTSSLFPVDTNEPASSASALVLYSQNLLPKKKSVKFDVLSSPVGKTAMLLRSQITGSDLGAKLQNVLAEAIADGEILKMDKMLVRIHQTTNRTITRDFDENNSRNIKSVVTAKFREYMVVCRKRLGDTQHVIQIYKTRVIPAVEKAESTSAKPKFEIPLSPKLFNVNLYSSLDKSIVMWSPCEQGSRIFIFLCNAPSSSVEWLTFMRGLLGAQRPDHLIVHVPDLDLSLCLQDPFETISPHSAKSQSEPSARGKDADPAEALAESIAKEEKVAQAVIDRSLEMLRADKERYKKLMDRWGQHGGQPIGLAWKRYDRLEWLHGVNEKRMFATFAMLRSHDLELRPKLHYPTSVNTTAGEELTEPPPVEGFLVRLTSQTGQHQRFQNQTFRLFCSTRLYFASFDHYLTFTSPNKAVPPRRTTSGPPQSSLITDIDPYPLNDFDVDWLRDTHESTQEAHDRRAWNEARRKLDLLENCDGFIDLTTVTKVEQCKAFPPPPNPQSDTAALASSKAERAAAIDDHDFADAAALPTNTTVTADEDDANANNCFQLSLTSGLVVRFKAYDPTTAHAWVNRLRQLCKYWRRRRFQDMRALISTRERNLHQLHVDEQGEAKASQFGRKWDFDKTYASPLVFNCCSIASCRDVRHAGSLYVKFRQRDGFARHYALLVPGALLLFQDLQRGGLGAGTAAVPLCHYARVRRIPLRPDETYLYAGFLVEDDLARRYASLRQQQKSVRGGGGEALSSTAEATTTDSGGPGLPRMWASEGWDSVDEDAMSCFVLWQASGRSWFREDTSLRLESGDTATAPATSSDATVAPTTSGGSGGRFIGLKRVSALGRDGNRMVFRARSRAERDLWVMCLATDMERANADRGTENVRLLK